MWQSAPNKYYLLEYDKGWEKELEHLGWVKRGRYIVPDKKAHPGSPPTNPVLVDSTDTTRVLLFTTHPLDVFHEYALVCKEMDRAVAQAILRGEHGVPRMAQ